MFNSKKRWLMAIITFAKRPLFFGLASVCLLIGLWAMSKGQLQGFASANSATKIKQKQVPPIINDVSSLQIVKAEITGNGELRLLLKNGSNKLITDYDVCIGDTFIGTSFYDEKMLAFVPGSTQEEVYPLQERMYEKGVRIAGVAFADGTGDGDPKFAVERAEERKGVEFVTAQVSSILNAALASADEKNVELADQIVAQIRAIPDDGGQGFSFRAKIGASRQKATLAYNFSHLEQVERDLSGNPITIEFVLLELQRKLNQYKRASLSRKNQ